jgi:Mg-chelatase subunit ChlI
MTTDWMASRATRPINVGTLVQSLGERTARARAQLAAVLSVLGPSVCRDLLLRTRALDARGGLLRRDGKRRSRGGVFFHLARERLSLNERRIIFGRLQRRLPRLRGKDVVDAFDVEGARRLWSLNSRAERKLKDANVEHASADASLRSPRREP